jgi:hypothetical protein
VTFETFAHPEFFMKEFFVGLLVILAVLLLSVIASLMLPLVLILSVFLRGLVYLAFVIFAIWLIGKVTLTGADYLKKGKKIEFKDDGSAPMP